MKKLHITGNGFDIYHGIPSSFSAFREFVETNDRTVWDACEDFLPADDQWSDLEAALGAIDTDYLLEANEHFLVSYGADDWSDSYHHDYEWAVNETSQALSAGLLEQFTAWVSRLVIPQRSEVADILENEKDSLFLSFNYTETLMKVYGVSRDCIFFPHGFIGDDPANLILGHAWKPEKKLVEFTDEDTDTRVAEALDTLDRYFTSTFKPSSNIIDSNQDYFESLGDVVEVFVYGHSLSEVDHPYFSKIILSIQAHAFWTVSYYKDPEPVRNELERLGIGQEFYRLVTLSELKKRHNKSEMATPRKPSD